jgi:hypothetical protein
MLKFEQSLKCEIAAAHLMAESGAPVLKCPVFYAETSYDIAKRYGRRERL